MAPKAVTLEKFKSQMRSFLVIYIPFSPSAHQVLSSGKRRGELPVGNHKNEWGKPYGIQVRCEFYSYSSYSKSVSWGDYSKNM